MSEIDKLPRCVWKDPIYPFRPIAPLPANTLRNADGTPYAAGHDSNRNLARQQLQEALSILEEKAEFHSDLHGKQLEHTCKLVREALELM